jgi:hypothetical protein
MGCDIHTYREKYVDGKWLSADPWEASDYGDDEKRNEIPYEKRAYTGRNYNLFGLLAGVRNREDNFSLKQRGLPFDVSPEVQQDAAEWYSDGHSHSYLYLHELRSLRAWVDVRMIPVSGMMRPAQLAALQDSIASGKPNWELLYQYCQWTTDKSQVEFCVDMPMSFMVGQCLDKMIDSFKGIEGENHRLVFWFDN